MKRVMAGMDLHGNNVMIGIVDADGTRLRHRRLACDLVPWACFDKTDREKGGIG
jgi:hypothetical protein